MNPILALVLLYAMCLSCGTYLVVTEHYGWAWIPFVLASCINLETHRPIKEKETK